jgi:hypothetical protein
LKFAFVGLAFALLQSGSAEAGEEKTVNAIATMEGVGQAFEVSPGRAWFLGAFAGVIFVEDGTGALNMGEIVCPGTLDLSVETLAQTGSGRCVITALDGDQVFAKWDCEGTHFVGCKGSFELIGGTGRFEGITGNSEFVFRSVMNDVVIDALNNQAAEAAVGIAVWHNLTYVIP